MTVSNNAAVTTALDMFQAEIKNSIMDHASSIISPEVLEELISQAIREMFFLKREEKQDHYPYKTVIKPSWFESAVVGVLRPEIENAVSSWVADNKEFIESHLKIVLTETAPALLLTCMNKNFEQKVRDLEVKMLGMITSEVKNVLNENRQ